MHGIKTKGIFGEATTSDGFSILVDWPWPRGVSKERVTLDDRVKAMTPGSDQRKVFGHMVDRMENFRERYRMELDGNDEKEAFLDRLFNRLDEQTVSLLYTAKDKTSHHARVLKEWVEEHLSDGA